MSSEQTILLVDDDADFVEMNRLLLEQHGYAVRVAYSGRQCLDSVAAGRPDIIILDMDPQLLLAVVDKVLKGGSG